MAGTPRSGALDNMHIYMHRFTLVYIYIYMCVLLQIISTIINYYYQLLVAASGAGDREVGGCIKRSPFLANGWMD